MAAHPNLRATIFVPREWGGLLPAVPFASELRARGISVTFAIQSVSSSPRFYNFERAIEFLESQRFPVIRLPQGPAVAPLIAAAAEAIADSDLVFAQDSQIYYAAPAASDMKVPIIALYICFVDFPSMHMPPIDSALVPGKSFLSALRIPLAWVGRSIRLYSMAAAGVLYSVFRTTELQAAITAIRKRRLEWGILGGIVLSVRLRHGIVLGPAALEYSPSPIRAYFGLHIPPTVPSGVDSGFKFPDEAKRVIYCSVGEYSHVYPLAKSFLELVVGAFRRRPDLSLILQIGKLEPETFSNRPSNVHLARWVPQAELLKRVELVITNGGFGTIKECISCSVPVLVAPFMADQIGNGARIAYHEIGVTVNPRKVSEEKLLSLIDNLLSNPKYRRNVQKLSAEIFKQRNAEVENTIRYIEAVLEPVKQH